MHIPMGTGPQMEARFSGQRMETDLLHSYSARLLIALSSIRETETCGLTLFWVAGPAKDQGLFVWDLIWFRRGLNLGNHKASFICISNKAIS